MKTYLMIFCAMVFFHVENKAADSLRFVKSINKPCKLFTTDPLGNIYAVKSNNSLVKYNANGDSLGLFNEVRKGNITHIDATNPLRLLVFFGDYAQVIILDNMLSIKSELKLVKIGLQNTRCVATSIDGRIWIYDPVDARLLKIDDNLSIQFSTSLRNVLPNLLDPVFMVEQNRNLYLIDTTHGIFKFDLFGFFNTSYNYQTKELQCFNSDLVFTQMPNLISYNTRTISEKKIPLPLPEQILQVRVERNKVYVLRSETIDIYSLD